MSLCLHAAYGAREILTAVGWLTAERRAPFQAGVLPLASRKTELPFVTLDKSEGYRACGRVALETADGDRPMSLVWKLETPPPTRLFREFSVLRGI